MRLTTIILLLKNSIDIQEHNFTPNVLLLTKQSLYHFLYVHATNISKLFVLSLTTEVLILVPCQTNNMILLK